MIKQNLHNSIHQIFKEYCRRSYDLDFTIESISLIFDIGNEVFMRNYPHEYEKYTNQPPSNAPDITDDEPFSFERTMSIFQHLQNNYKVVNPELIQHIFEINSKYAWREYRLKYRDYIYSIYENNTKDEYINYLAAVLLYEDHAFSEALKYLNLATAINNSSAQLSHLKGLCLMQLGEFDIARSNLYQSLFLIELLQDVPPRLSGQPEIYPNFPLEYDTTADLIRLDLKTLDDMETIYKNDWLPLLEAI